MLTPRQLDVYKTILSVTQNYRLVIKEMLDDPSKYGIDVGTEDEVLEGLYVEFGSIEASLVTNEYDPESIAMRFAKAKNSFKSIALLRNPSGLATVSMDANAAEGYKETYARYTLNSMKHFLGKVKADPMKYLSSDNTSEVANMIREIDLMIALQDEDALPDICMDARMMELCYVFLYEIVCIIDARYDYLYKEK